MFELGNNLREARQGRRIDLVIAEQDTKIRSKYLAALESEDFDILPGPVTAVDQRWKPWPGRQPARMPIHSPTAVAMTVAVPTSRSVGPTRSPMRPQTGRLYFTESTPVENGFDA